MAKFADWENIISANVNGAPLPAIIDAVRDACIHFCRDTHIIRRTVTVDIEASRPTIEVPDVDGLFPGRVVEVFSSCGLVRAYGFPELAEWYPAGWVNVRVSTARQFVGWVSENPGSLRLIPHSSVDMPGELQVTAAMQPHRNATDAPNFLYEMFAHEIGMGAIAMLHAHVDAPYANPQMVYPAGQAFQDAINRHAYRAGAGHGKQRLRTRVERP